MHPLVSICIPTYNRASLVKCAIASAQKQTYPNIEIIVTDNCSTDKTEQVVKEIIKSDPRVRYIRNETNVGPTKNWQIAVNAAKGEFCKILFSDDEIAPEFVSSCIEMFESGNDVAFVLTDGIIGYSFEDEYIYPAYCQPNGISNSRDYILKYLMRQAGADSPACAIFRTSDLTSKIVTANPLFETDKYLQNGAGPDCLIFLNAALHHSEIAYIHKPLTLFRSGGDSISSIASNSAYTSTLLLNCYAKARYQFLRGLSGNDEIHWYLRFISVRTAGIKNVLSYTKLISTDFRIKNGRRLTLISIFIGIILRLFDNKLVKPRVARILSSYKHTLTTNYCE